MRICLLTVGSRGDVQPYVALGQGLQAAGHIVRLTTHTRFEDLVRKFGLDFSPVIGDPQTILNSEEGRAFTTTGKNLLRFMRAFMHAFQPFIEQLTEDAFHALQGMDLLVCHPLAFPAFSVAEKLGLPMITAPLQPIVRTRAFPNPSLSPSFSLGRSYNYWTYLLAEQLFWQFSRSMAQGVRRQLGLSPYSFWGNAGQLYKHHHPYLCGYSPLVVPQASDLGGWIHITGYWFLDASSDWQPSPSLVDFLQAGPPPVSIGFGSMSDRHSEEMTTLVVRALEKARLRGILLTGWGGLSNADLPDDIFKLEEVPHDWLFPQVAAVVHHGGAGTTAAALRAGVPSVVVPFFGDQIFWGQRVAALETGPNPIPQKQLSVHALTEALKMSTQNAQIRSHASIVGTQLRAEQGVERAVRAIEQIYDPARKYPN